MHFANLISVVLVAPLASAQNFTQVLGNNPNLSALSSLIGSYPSELAALNSASNITLLAPSNEALSQALNSTAGIQDASVPGFIQALLSYHVLQGTIYAANITNSSQIVPTLLNNATYDNVTGGQVVECALSDGNVTLFSGLKKNVSVIKADLSFSGGLIHIIDGLLTIPENITATAQAANLTALVGAIQTLDLTSTIDGLSDVTVFAPDNAAFQSISSVLSNASTDDLTSIISYHVINGTVAYSPTLTNTTVTTLGGKNLTISVINGTVFVDSARVINPDVLVANGVVHVIDGVLNPNNTSATANPTESTATPAFSGASSAGSIPFTSGVTAPTSSIAAAGSATTSPEAGSKSSSSSGAAALPMKTGAAGAAALFGGAAMIANW